MKRRPAGPLRDREEHKADETANGTGDDIEALKDELSALQDKLDQLSRRSN